MTKETGRDAMAESWTTFKLFHGGELRDDAARALALKAHSHGYVDGRVDAPAAGEAVLDERGRVARFGDLVQHDPDHRPALVSTASERGEEARSLDRLAAAEEGWLKHAEGRRFVAGERDVAAAAFRAGFATGARAVSAPKPGREVEPAPAAAASEARVHCAIALGVRLSDEDARKVGELVERVVAAEAERDEWKKRADVNGEKAVAAVREMDERFERWEQERARADAAEAERDEWRGRAEAMFKLYLGATDCRVECYYQERGAEDWAWHVHETGTRDYCVGFVDGQRDGRWRVKVGDWVAYPEEERC